MREMLVELDVPAFEEGAVLLVSELVTNAVLHTKSAPEVTIRLDDRRLWIGVRDGSNVIPAPKRYGPNAATGRGLQLVEKVAASWGIQKDDAGGKVVWFQLDDRSAERYARAEKSMFLEEIAALEIDLSGPVDPTALDVTDPSRTPGVSSERTARTAPRRLAAVGA